MKVILTQTVEPLGEAGSIIDVQGGYARNFLLPRKLAVLADEGNMNGVAHQKRVIADRRKRELASIQDRIEKIESKSITISKKSGEQDKLFGSVTTSDIVETLEKEGIDFVDKKQLHLEESIKQLGVYTIPVKLGLQHVAQLKLFVVSES